MLTDEILKTIPLIILTASVMKEQEDELKKIMGRYGYLKKPISKKDLIYGLMRFLPYVKQEETRSSEEEKLPSPEIFTEETKASLIELLNILNSNMMNEWEALKDCIVIKKCKKFSEKIIDLCNSYKVNNLKKWGEMLHKLTVNFDIKGIEQALISFPDLVKEISELLHQE